MSKQQIESTERGLDEITQLLRQALRLIRRERKNIPYHGAEGALEIVQASLEQTINLQVYLSGLVATVAANRILEDMADERKIQRQESESIGTVNYIGNDESFDVKR